MIQVQLLNYILSNKNSSILINNSINEDFLYEYPDEYKFIKNHLDTYGEVPDITTFLSSFPKFDVIEVKESEKYLVDELYKQKSIHDFVQSQNSILKLFNSGKIDEALQSAVTLSEKLTNISKISCTDIINDTSRYDAYIEKTRNFNKYYVTTGFIELDHFLGGWDRLEELATIIARPGVGKSWVLLKCAIGAAKQGLNVGIYSGEMTAQKVGYRFDTLFGHVSNSSIMRGKIEVQSEYKSYIDSLSGKLKGSIKILTPSDLSGGGHPATVSDLRAFIERENLDALFVDQHSLLDDELHGKSAVEKASNISKSLKTLQTLKKIPIICVSQMNRTKPQTAVEDDEQEFLDLTQIAQSDRIGQDSTVVIGITHKDNVLTLHLVKSRDAVSGKKIKYAIDLDKGIFNYLPVEGDIIDGSGSEDLKNEYDEPQIFTNEEDPF